MDPGDRKGLSVILLADGTTTVKSIVGIRAQLLSDDSLLFVEIEPWPDRLVTFVTRLLETDRRLRVLGAEARPVMGDVLAATIGYGRMLVLDAGCTLLPGALDRLARAPESGMVYADEVGFHKPAWSIELALEQDLVGPLALFRRHVLEGVRDAPLTTPHDLALRSVDAATDVRHLAVILGQGAAPRRAQPGLAAVAAALGQVQTERVRAEVVESALQPGQHRILWRPATAVAISVIIPIRDRADLLERCVDGLLHHTEQPVHEIIIADNGSVAPETTTLLARLARDGPVRVLPVPGSFNFSKINNEAARIATGQVLLLLNNDIEVVEPGWLGEMAAHAMRQDVGAVGARLLYPDRTIQHAGIVLGVGAFEGGPGVAGHFGYGQRADEAGYQGQLVKARELSAVTGACLALRREVFEQAGALDAENLAVALNDLDLCLRIRALGLRVVWTPFATLLHHESASRGAEQPGADAERFHHECRFMRERWGEVLDQDPFYNPHFSRFDHSFLAAR